MLPEKKKTAAVLVMVIVMIVLVVLGLTYYYLSSKGYIKTSPMLKTISKTTDSNSKSQPASTTVIETGFLQAIEAKQKTENGVNYTHVIGMIDDAGNPILVWLTEEEYKTLVVVDATYDPPLDIKAESVHGGRKIKVTKISTVSKNTEQGTVNVELI